MKSHARSSASAQPSVGCGPEKQSAARCIALATSCIFCSSPTHRAMMKVSPPVTRKVGKNL